MKLLHLLSLFLLIIACLDGCSKPQNSDANVNGSSNSNGSTQAISSTDAANFSRGFEGTINNQYAIEMNLQRNGDNLSGTYLYSKHKVDIPIKGTIDGQGNFVINEFDNKGNQTGIFKGKLVSGNAMDGTWSKPNGDKSMPFSLKAAGNSNEVASTNSGSSSNTPTNSQPVPTAKSTNELNRDTILSLMRGRFSNEVKVSMSTSSYTMRNLTDLYSQMIKAKVITCQSAEGHYRFCRPGSNGSALYQSEQEAGTVTAGSLSLNIGRNVPSSVNGISRLDQASAYADVLFSFEANGSYSLYTKWSDAFYRRPNTQGEQHRVLLRLYDDGWRVERVN